MSMIPTAPQSIGQVLDSSFRIFRASWNKVWPLALAGALLGYVGDGYQLFFAKSDASKAIGVLLTFVGAIASVAFYSAIYLREHAIATDVPTGGEVGVALRLIPRMILMSLALALVIAGCAVPFGILIGVVVSNPERLPWWTVAVLAVVLLIPPTIYLIRLVLGSVVLLVENRRAVESLKVSSRLVKGDWWRSFGVLSVGGVILIVAYSLIGVAAAIAAPLLSAQEATVAIVFGAVVGMILVGLIVTPYFVALMLALYYDLKLRKEGGDIAARIDSLD